MNARVSFDGPGFGRQHDDHIWMTFHGEGWAIRAIERRPALRIHFWRGYWPDLEFVAVDFLDPDWAAYCAAAVQQLEDHHG